MPGSACQIGLYLMREREVKFAETSGLVWDVSSIL